MTGYEIPCNPTCGIIELKIVWEKKENTLIDKLRRISFITYCVLRIILFSTLWQSLELCDQSINSYSMVGYFVQEQCM